MASSFLRALYLWLKNRLSPLPSLAEMAAARVAAADRDHAAQIAVFDRELLALLPPDDRFARMAPNEFWRLAQCNQAAQLGNAAGNLRQYAPGGQCGSQLQDQIGAVGGAYQGKRSSLLPDLLGL